MYECYECGEEFETPATDIDIETGERFNCCPSCGSDDIVEVDDYTYDCCDAFDLGDGDADDQVDGEGNL